MHYGLHNLKYIQIKKIIFELSNSKTSQNNQSEMKIHN